MENKQMKVAGVSLTYNDGYKLKEWHDHYIEYKKFLDIYVIVDNNSNPEYKRILKDTFPDAVIIERDSNGGCTGAYNDGIKYILQNTDADAILIISNDLKITEKCIPEMYDYLIGDPTLGMVSTAILYKDSNIIDNYGHILKDFVVTCCDEDKNISDITEMKRYTDLLSGGFTMAKREFYEKAGLQDEKLFMYCDEIDTTYKARKYGFKLGVIANEYAWHQHINPPILGKRSSASRYLICRNRIYLAKKYENTSIILYQFYRGLIITPLIYVCRFFKYRKITELKDAWYSFVGGVHGMVGLMKYNDYMDFNK